MEQVEERDVGIHQKYDVVIVELFQNMKVTIDN